jgi:hypothetical protein
MVGDVSSAGFDRLWDFGGQILATCVERNNHRICLTERVLLL